MERSKDDVSFEAGLVYFSRSCRLVSQDPQVAHDVGKLAPGEMSWWLELPPSLARAMAEGDATCVSLSLDALEASRMLGAWGPTFRSGVDVVSALLACLAMQTEAWSVDVRRRATELSLSLR